MKNGQPRNEAEPSALSSVDSTQTSEICISFPVRYNTVTAEVMARLFQGETLTGMDAVLGMSTTRLAAFINSIGDKYISKIERVDINVGTKDGRVAEIRAYFLSRVFIRKAFDMGALEFCRSVASARAKQRNQALKAKAEAKRRNAARKSLRIDARQLSLLGGQ